MFMSGRASQFLKASLLLFSFPVAAQPAATLYQSPLVRQWVADFNAGHRVALLASIEANLSSGNSDPLAPAIWCDLHDGDGNLPAAWKAVTDEKVKTGLGVLPQLEIDFTWSRFSDAQKTASSRKGRLTARELAWLAKIQYAADDDKAAAATIAEALQLAPNVFWITNVADAWMTDRRFRADIATEIGSGRIPLGSPFVRYESHRSTDGTMGRYEWNSALHEWPNEENDAVIQGLVGWNALNVHRFAEAAAAYTRAIALYPLGRDRYARLAAALMRDGQWDKADQVSDHAAASFALNSSDLATERVLFSADAELDAGENGRARRTLCLTEAPDAIPPACAGFPAALRGDARYIEMQGTLEDNSGRSGLYAAALDKIADPTPAQLIIAAEYKAKANDIDGAWDAFQRIEAVFPEHLPNYYGGAVYILDLAKRPQEQLTWSDLGLKQYPNYVYIHRERAVALAALGRNTDAVAEWMRVFTMEDPVSWTLTALRKAEIALDPKAANAVMDTLQSQFPSVEAVWVDAAAQLDNDQYDARSALWERAALLNPTVSWPWSHLQDTYNDRRDWAKARDALARGAQATKSGRHSAQRDVQDYFLWQLQAECTANGPNPQGPTAEDVITAQEISKQDDAAGDDLFWITRRNATLADKSGHQKAAADLTFRAFQLEPDNWEVGFSAVTVFYKEIGVGRVMHAAYHYLDRAPYDGARLDNLTQIAAEWHVNPIETLRLLDLTKRRAPGSYSSTYYGKAEGQLGDYATYYKSNYSADDIVGRHPSDRYIEWFDAARLNVQGQTNQIKHIDYDQDQVTLRLPSGQIVTRGWYRYGGKPTLIKVGSVYIRLTYDDAANLTRIEQANSHFVSFSYDDKDRIELMMNSEGDALGFKYNEASKPIEISLKGVGIITVAYKPNNEIDKVDSTAGSAIATKVTSAFQQLQTLMAQVNASTSSITASPELPFNDPALAKLQDAYQTAQVLSRLVLHTASNTKYLQAVSSSGSMTTAGLGLAKYLVAHAEDSRSNEEQAQKLLLELIEAATKGHTPTMISDGARAMELLHRLYLDVRPDGIDADDWNSWKTAHDWLLHHDVSSSEAHRVNDLIDKQPIHLLPPDEWERKSYLSSPGYWRAFDDPRLKDAQAVLVRGNHDYVVGTPKGILVFRQGHWVSYSYDPIARKFSNTAEPSGTTSDVHALSEDALGNLWIGTISGLIRIKGEYDSTVARWSSSSDGLVSGYIQSIVSSEGNLYVAAQGGLSYSSDSKTFHPVPELASASITCLFATISRTPSKGSDEGAPAPDRGARPLSPVLVATDSDVWLLHDGHAHKLHDGGAQGLAFDKGIVYEWQSDTLSAYELKPDDSMGDTFRVPDQQRIVKSKHVFGLAVLPIEEDDRAIAVLTDQGMSLYKDGHFEQQTVKLITNRPAGITAFASNDLRTLLLTTEGLFGIERGQAIQDTDGEVYDLLSDPEQAVTFVARGSSLQTVSQTHPEAGATTLDSIRSTHLALDPQGRLVTNDGVTIVRYEKGSIHATEIFEAAHAAGADAASNGAKSDFPPPTVRSILAGSDGTIWVASGGELFRWKEGMKTPEEYSVYVDPAKFPAPTDMVSRVYETLDHRVIVICSDESHLFYRGIKLSGGVLQWEHDHLVRIPLQEDTSSWFITGYTPLDGESVMLGTTRGFVLERKGVFTDFVDAKNSSFIKMAADAQITALGTKGTQLGDNTWLFGSAGGLLAYSSGTWFYPDRLNRMLPEDYRFAGTYGVRDVHAVASDAAGHIYVGNDRGLLVYDSGGGDSRSFLISSQNLELAMQSIEDEKLSAEQEIFAASNTRDGAAVKQIHATRREIDRLEARSTANLLTNNGTEVAPEKQAASGGLSNLQVNGKDLSQKTLDQLAQAKQKYLTELLKLEQSNPHLHEALGEPQPLYIASLKQRLADGQVLLQYIPAGNSLAISVVTRNSARLVMVNGVAQADLDLRSQRAWYSMARGRVTESPKDVLDALQGQATPLYQDLLWLYDKLLRPVEGDLQGSSSVLIVPNGRLTYVPFGALMRSAGENPEYAIQRYTFGYMPSLYLFDKLDQGIRRASDNSVILADPDGSLPNADQEAASISAIMQGAFPPRVGADANLSNLMQLAPQAGILHLATHAILDPVHPEASYLLLAKNRFSVVDAMTLPLTANDLVVLSACETGIGGQGMEYVHLAFAFSYAGSPSVVASLWQVPDQSTSDLMIEFYKYIKAGDNHFTAMTKAQRAMLAKHPQPRDWAGFITMGRP